MQLNGCFPNILYTILTSLESFYLSVDNVCFLIGHYGNSDSNVKDD